MSHYPDFSVTKLSLPNKGTLIAFVTDDMALPALFADHEDVLQRAIKATKFKGKAGSKLDVVAPHGFDCDRIIMLGLGEAKRLKKSDFLNAGGKVIAALGADNKAAITLQLGADDIDAENAGEMALGMTLRSYKFDRYKTKASKKGDDDNGKATKIAFMTNDASAMRKALEAAAAVADGVILARDMVNEPANILGPEEFAAEAKKLEEIGLKVTVLTEKEMKKLGMGALLGVAQGSVKPARLAVMEWSGGKAKDAPLAFIGKGVTFDTGGISIKPAGGMEDMKGDMGGAAAVIGLMKTLGLRKAKINVVGAIGLVENMPDANAQRPGDIVTSMSGQTIEVLNTDAEGRLVLADVLTYINQTFKPVFMVNLATLTGAILVALGNHHAGLFSNNDDLAKNLFDAGTTSGEKVWRMPLSPDYDKLIDSKNADMKNIGGRFAGSITAAQFLQRFVGDTPWAHLDVAGTAMGSLATDINTSWASGFGVRLLDEMVRTSYEK